MVSVIAVSNYVLNPICVYSLSTTIGYIPPSAPASPSSLRSAAYLSGTPLLGPSEDPEGWEVLPEVEMHGTAFKQRKVVVKLRVSVLFQVSIS